MSIPIKVYKIPCMVMVGISFLSSYVNQLAHKMLICFSNVDHICFSSAGLMFCLSNVSIFVSCPSSHSMLSVYLIFI